MEEPLISVVMPSYNTENYISKAIQSVLNQSYKNLELIIIDDCSIDKTRQIVEEYCKKDKRVKAYFNQKNSGVSYSRNFGIEKAKGSWIAFLDSDDMWEEEKLKKQINLLVQKQMKPILIYTGSAFIDENGIPYKYVMEVPETVRYKELLKQNVISCSSVLIKREIISSIKMENDNMHEDFVVWLKVLRNYDICAYGVNEPLLVYRMSSNSKSGNKFKAAKMTYMVYKHMNLNFIKRNYYMLHYVIRSIIKYKNTKGSR